MPQAKSKFNQRLEKLPARSKAWLAEAGTGTVFRPTAKQRQIWDIVRRAKPYTRILIGYGGAVGGGKTRALAEYAIDALLEFPGNIVLLGRRDMVDLRDTTMQEFKRAIPRDVVVRENQRFEYMDLRLKDWPAGVASRIYFRGLKDMGSLGSTAYGAVLIDEAHEVPVDVAQYVFGRLRWRLPPQIEELGYVQKYVFLAASNPFPGWFQKWFVNRDLPEAVLADKSISVHFIPARVKDNPHIDPGYELSLRAMYPESWVRRLVEGEWDVIEGAVYPEFNPRVHRWQGSVSELRFRQLIGGLDFGGTGQTAHATAGLLAGITTGGILIRVAEFLQRGGDRPIERLVKWMGEVEEKWRTHHMDPKYADVPVTWIADGSQHSFVQLLNRAFHIRPARRNRGSVRYGIALVSQRLAQKPPGSFYLPSLINFEEQMLRYHWPQRHSPDSPLPSSPVEIDDDILDCDRYIHAAIEEQRPSLKNITLPSISTPHQQPSIQIHTPASPAFISYQPRW